MNISITIYHTDSIYFYLQILLARYILVPCILNNIIPNEGKLFNELHMYYIFNITNIFFNFALGKIK